MFLREIRTNNLTNMYHTKPPIFYNIFGKIFTNYYFIFMIKRLKLPAWRKNSEAFAKRCENAKNSWYQLRLQFGCVFVLCVLCFLEMKMGDFRFAGERGIKKMRLCSIISHAKHNLMKNQNSISLPANTGKREREKMFQKHVRLLLLCWLFCLHLYVIWAEYIRIAFYSNR